MNKNWGVKNLVGLCPFKANQFLISIDTAASQASLLHRYSCYLCWYCCCSTGISAPLLLLLHRYSCYLCWYCCCSTGISAPLLLLLHRYSCYLGITSAQVYSWNSCSIGTVYTVPVFTFYIQLLNRYLLLKNSYSNRSAAKNIY